MMAYSTLVVRNVTTDDIHLKRFEYYEILPTVNSGAFSNVTANFTSMLGSRPRPKVIDDARCLAQEDLHLRLEPYKVIKTNIKSANTLTQRLRLVFEVEGEQHRLDIPSTNSQSAELEPSTSEPRFNLTAIYLPQHSHLTLYSSANLSSWMRKLKDDTPLSALSIPGTHNSPTCHRALPSVRCQARSPLNQLENGVRFFDIRVQIEAPQDPTKDGLILVHSVFPISLTGTKYFRNLFTVVTDFLDRNPSETIIMSVKREGTGAGTDQQLSRILRDHYAGDVNRWFTTPRVPFLGEARRKIVLIRRFALDDALCGEYGGAGWGIDASIWADNTPNATCPSGDICVQDFYEVLETENIEQKIQYSQDHLVRAAQCVCCFPSHDKLDPGQMPKQPFYINFLTASNFWKVGCWPDKIAAKLNPAIVEFLCRKHHVAEEDDEGQGAAKTVGDGSTGIVVCDWVGHNGNWDIVRCIVGMNARLELREHAIDVNR